MPVFVNIPSGTLVLEPKPLSQDAFSAFGTVIENPAPSLIPSANLKKLPSNAVQANQGSALKYLDVTHMKNFYGAAPSHVPGKAVMNMFVCAPRSLSLSQTAGIEGTFPVEILERHPYTTQTFVPLGVSPSEAKQARYLVIVAPSLPPSAADKHLPMPTSTDSSEHLPGRGLPDLRNIKAYMANGSQAVTYGAGTWHAPMVVIGTKPIDFVVVQFANGVGVEDCQETEFRRGGSISVAVPKPELTRRKGLSRL